LQNVSQSKNKENAKEREGREASGGKIRKPRHIIAPLRKNDQTAKPVNKPILLKSLTTKDSGPHPPFPCQNPPVHNKRKERLGKSARRAQHTLLNKENKWVETRRDPKIAQAGTGSTLKDKGKKGNGTGGVKQERGEGGIRKRLARLRAGESTISGLLGKQAASLSTCARLRQ